MTAARDTGSARSAPTSAPAGLGRRLGAAVIDFFLIVAVAIPLNIIAGGALMMDTGTSPADMATVERAGQVITVGLFVLYFTIFTGGRAQATPGKRALGLQVVRRDGAPVGIGLAFLRTLAYAVSVAPALLGIVMIAVDRERRALHDVICRTRVLRIDT